MKMRKNVIYIIGTFIFLISISGAGIFTEQVGAEGTEVEGYSIQDSNYEREGMNDAGSEDAYRAHNQQGRTGTVSAKNVDDGRNAGSIMTLLLFAITAVLAYSLFKRKKQVN
ncbi:hypothetical protein [Evansella tamaricis]|uniref:Sortase B protein-sorting domain-containing protein n=1 Tax=Evansella tamaricis TaxID=2069301 RepID=A0ABS6JHE6_9BACI|nr:hypothetical protein [Evansella tamaricis]MBU9713095.1 hypothetical protein [Evansella tamaricis]